MIAPTERVTIDVAQTQQPEIGLRPFFWDTSQVMAVNLAELGRVLAGSEDIFRRPGRSGGMILFEEGEVHEVCSASDLAPIVIDRLDISKPIPDATLAKALRCASFLDRFPTVDYMIYEPTYLPDFKLVGPGYTDGGKGHRVLCIGGEAEVLETQTHITDFLDQMDFASTADRTNAVAGLLTGLLRYHWQGDKPILVVTASKSQAGKDTVIKFAAGLNRMRSISYQGADWAVETNFVQALLHDPMIGCVVIENARLNSKQRVIESGYIERFVTDPTPLLSTTRTQSPKVVANHYLLAISTNYGQVSQDIHNRSLPVHLEPSGDVEKRQSVIGNPKQEYLPKYERKITAEARGMIQRWIESGKPLDEDVAHPFSAWAKTVGGILKANGFEEFLANYSQRKTADNPERRALGILGAEFPNQWYRTNQWAEFIERQGLANQLIGDADRSSQPGRERGTGVVLSNHENETFVVTTEDEVVELRLERRRSRFDGEQPHLRSRFIELSRNPLEVNHDESI